MKVCSYLVVFFALSITVLLYLPILFLEDWRHTPYYQKYSSVAGSLIQIGERQVHYFLEGPEDADLVVVLHGISNCALSMEPLYKPLMSNYRVLAFDIYGRGHSQALESDVHTEEFYANQIGDLVDRLFEEKLISKKQKEHFHIAALSMGGGISVVFSAMHPERVKSLVLLAPAGLPMEMPFIANILSIPYFGEYLQKTPFGRWAADSRLSPSFVNPDPHIETIKDWQAMNHFHSEKVGFIEAVLNSLRSFPLGGLLEWYKKVGSAKFPVLLIWGTDDKTIPYTNAQTALQLIPRAELVSIENSGHSLFVEHQTETIEAIFAFWDRHFPHYPVSSSSS